MRKKQKNMDEIIKRLEKMTRDSLYEMDLQLFELAILHAYFGIKIFHEEFGDEASIDLIHFILKSVLEGDNCEDSIKNNLNLIEKKINYKIRTKNRVIN